MQDDFKKYKKIYWDIKLSNSQVEKSWQEVKNKISAHTTSPALHYRVVFLSLFFISLIGITGFAQVTTPGAKLYPVKIISEKAAAKVSGQPQIIIERRAQELIEVSKKQPEKLEEASKQYQKSLDEIQTEGEKNHKKRGKVNNSLNRQEQKLKKAIEENPTSEKALKRALENTKALKERLKKDSR